MSKRNRIVQQRRPPNVTQLLVDRCYYDIETIIKNRLVYSSSFIRRLELDAILEGHNGCVNCLEWNATGTLLASGSDDCHIMIWDPFRKRCVLDFATPHHGNIFSVKFMPNSHNVATAAADGQVFLFDTEKANITPIWKCHCHHSRVKRLATVPDSSHLLWSVGEDGNIMQFDLRIPHTCRENEKVLLIDLQRHMGPNAEPKSLAINARRTEQLAVGANDVYARLYDRRMISLTTVNYRIDFQLPRSSLLTEDNVPRDCVTYFCPGHLGKHKYHEYGGLNYFNKAITHLTFSPDGDELLANVGGEQIYLFDVIGGKKPVFLDLPPRPSSTDDHSDNEILKKKLNLTPQVELLKGKGNSYLERKRHNLAIFKYTEAMSQAPECPILYTNRAVALLRRGWFGDHYEAARDCHTVLHLDPTNVKAHFRLTRALIELNMFDEARECHTELKIRFSSPMMDKAIDNLLKELDEKQQQAENCLRSTPLVSDNISENETYWRSMAIDYKERFVGHANTTTDIKEANYFGNDKNFVIAGSDDGNFFIWDRSTGLISNIFKGDNSIVNCVQPNAHVCLLATSGIDHEIRLWSPQPIEIYEGAHNRLSEFDSIVSNNQESMKSDAFNLTRSGTVCRSS